MGDLFLAGPTKLNGRNRYRGPYLFFVAIFCPRTMCPHTAIYVSSYYIYSELKGRNQKKIGTAALKAKELDDKYGGAPVQVRVTQNKKKRRPEVQTCN